MDFVKIAEYKVQDPDKPTIEIDSKELVIGCIAAEVEPISVRSNGTKCYVTFYRDEAAEPIRKMQLALAGVKGHKLPVDYCAIIAAEVFWRNLMSMQRNVAALSKAAVKV